MRSYHQYCSVAKALDVVGDRWTLLIIRELALRGACRYTDLRDGLPGIATNLLAERLRELEAAGVLMRRDAPPPVATALIELTDRGRALVPIVHDLGMWGLQYMVDGPAPDDSFRCHWLTFPAELFLTDGAPDGPPASLEMRVDDEAMAVRASEGKVAISPGPAEHPDAVLAGAPAPLLGLISGHLDLDAAVAKGLHFEGSRETVERLMPRRAPVA
ncbi:MAG TPA: helix-turn-helix domain-containing protein [Solirubrobacteraceae bacterium]|nr:helix-turn-helix domain-containing protein [Solirubrobacteraceae bacterium]